jgi:zinc transport system substrate-binding protein
MPTTSRILVATGLALSLTVLAACSSSGTDSASDSLASGADRPTVVAAFYPLAYAAERVGADAIDVTSLTPPGVEPHDLELSAAQVAQIAEADLVLYIKGFQPAVDEAVEQQAADRAIDVSAGLTLLPGDAHEGEESDGGTDPHVWLDPANMAAVGEAVGQRVRELVPAAADAVSADTADFRSAMTDLSTEYRDGLAQCASRELVVSHEAFGYLAQAFGFTQVGLSGLSPEAEPSPARLKEVADLVRADGITTIYYETLVDPKVAQTVADETGATTAVLDPIEGLAPDATGDYESIMRQNLATLIAGQSCS